MCLSTQFLLLAIIFMAVSYTANILEDNVKGYEWPINTTNDDIIAVISNQTFSRALSSLKKVIKDYATISEFVYRIDKYRCDQNIVSQFYWAWHNGTCNGLADDKWKPSNGRVLGAALCSDMYRLKSYGIDKRIRGGVAVDIGAHIGDSTIPMALLVNHTIAFDPSVSVYKSLQATAALNANLNIDTYNLGISPTDSEIKFQWGKGYECNGGIAGRQRRHNKVNWVTRKTVQLDAFLVKRYGVAILHKISYIKIDVEGYDMVILLSLYPMLTNIIAAGATLPIIQVEYFLEFKRQARGGKLRGKDVVQLFSTIANLPGNYSVYCSNQCNYDRGSCVTESMTHNALTITTTHSSISIPITTSMATNTTAKNNSNKNNNNNTSHSSVTTHVLKRRAIEIHFTNDKKRHVLCEDLMLVPPLTSSTSSS